MVELQKVTDSNKIVTDPVLLNVLAKRGIDKDYVEFVQDYGKRVKGKSSPYMKLYRDLRTNKRFAVFSQLPMVDADGNKVEVGWKEAAINYFTEKNNLFHCSVPGTRVEITVKNDQPDGRKAGDKLTFKPQLFLDGIEQKAPASVLLDTDPVNQNYHQNVLEWDYGICKRRFRIIEGRLLGAWVFDKKPAGEIRIKYNQSGSFKLKLGQFKVDDDTELIEPEQFDELAEFGGYPVTISDSATFYPDAHPETTSVDGFVRRGDPAFEVTGQTWSAITGASTGYAKSDDGTMMGAQYRAAVSSGWWALMRGFALFDTSPLPDGAAKESAILSLYGYSKRDDSGTAPEYNIYSSNPASNTALVVGDYSKVGSTAFSAGIGQASINDAGYNDWDFNASGVAAVDTTGISKFSLRTNKDATVTEPSPKVYMQSTWAYFYSVEQGSGYKPKLVVVYSTAIEELKVWDGAQWVTPASIKRWDGAQWANIVAAHRWNGAAWERFWG